MKAIFNSSLPFSGAREAHLFRPARILAREGEILKKLIDNKKVKLHIPMVPLSEDTKKPKSYLLKLYLGLVVISLISYLFVKYFLSVQGLPTSFKKGVELLINNKEVVSRIGSYTSYTVNKDRLPKETDNPAFFKIALTGDSAKTIYLTCKMQKMESGSWTLKTIKIDSLKVNH